MAIATLRQVLCPALTIRELLEATSQGRLLLGESKRSRRLQRDTLSELLQGWILG